MRIDRSLAVLSLVVLMLLTSGTWADWINLTGAETAPNTAEITVMDDQVRVVLEVYVGDLDKFEDLVPDDLLRDGGAGRPILPERIGQFSESGLQDITETGQRLQARLDRVVPRMRTDRQSPFASMINPLTRRRVPKAPADKRVLYAELVYPFGGKPVGGELAIKLPREVAKVLGSVSANRSYSAKSAVRDRSPPLLPV